MFEWLEQTPAVYDTNHVDYKRRIQLFGVQEVTTGDGLDGATLVLWFKSCRTVISKCKTRKSGTNWTPSPMVPLTRRGCGPRCWLVSIKNSLISNDGFAHLQAIMELPNHCCKPGWTVKLCYNFPKPITTDCVKCFDNID